MISRRHNTRFSLMVAGSRGAGKSAFLNSLVNKEIVKLQSSTEIDLYLLNLDCDGAVQRITFIDTPGFGDSIDDESIQESIVDYIKEQFDSYIEEETKIRRNAKYEDTRVHCLVYLITGTGNGLKQRDIVFLKKISGLVNVIPVISKVEGMTQKELTETKKIIRAQIEYYNIKLFNFENETLVASQMLEQKINGLVPFACVFPENVSEDLRTRVHPNGVIEVDNIQHNDYAKLRDVISNTYKEALIESTDTDLYEKYRSAALENILQE